MHGSTATNTHAHWLLGIWTSKRHEIHAHAHSRHQAGKKETLLFSTWPARCPPRSRRCAAPGTCTRRSCSCVYGMRCGLVRWMSERERWMRHVQGQQPRHHRMRRCPLAYAFSPALAGVGGAHELRPCPLPTYLSYLPSLPTLPYLPFNLTQPLIPLDSPALARVGGAHDIARVEGPLDELGDRQLGVGLGALAVMLGWINEVWGMRGRERGLGCWHYRVGGRV